MNRHLSAMFLVILSFTLNAEKVCMDSEIKMPEKATPVVKKILSNGMTVLVREVHTVPKVSVQLWYSVGSKDEKDKEKGIAHLIEHMIFKGTDKLSESDINTVTHMLSGSCNAFTSYDYTGYLFNFPTQHWHEALRIMSDCMTNCTFKEFMLSSEMKAVIQELKMVRDQYVRNLVDEIISVIFQDHPYHHPIIGYKQDLWSVHSDDLMAFYKKHYVPNNATLVVVGDVDPEEVFAAAQENFGAIPADSNYKKEEFYYNSDVVSKSVTLYRDVKQPTIILTFVIPGMREKKDNVLQLLARILGGGKSSRLYTKLVNELQLATSVSASSEELFDHGLFMIAIEPKKVEDIATIEAVVLKEIERLVQDGFTDQELTSAIKQTEMAIYSLLENFQEQAYEIGKYYLATGDENYLFNYLNKPHKVLAQEVHEVAAKYLRGSVMHKGYVLPLPAKDHDLWAEVQQASDREDQRILSARQRDEDIEPPVYAKKVQVKDPVTFDFPKATVTQLANGLKVFTYPNSNIPKIDIMLDLKAKYYFDPSDKQGLSQFVSKMMLEGTKKYSAQQLMEAIESRGMSIAVYPGGLALSMLKEDLPFGLEIITEILTNAKFDLSEIEKVRGQMLVKLKNFWDEPRSFGLQLVREKLYKGHPYSKNALGSLESIKDMTRDDLVGYYKSYISPDGARIAIVGDIEGYDLNTLLGKTIGTWKGPKVADINFPKLDKAVAAQECEYPINRDQVFLCFAAISVDRKHPDYDKLLIFDQVFGGGVLGSMSSRLFDLREQSGLFYTINGSLNSGADEQPGMFLVRTIVSLDRLAEAEKAICNTINTVAGTIQPGEFVEAKNAIINAQIDNFASNYGIAQVFLFIDRYSFPVDFFDKRAATLNKITDAEAISAAKNILSSKLLTLRVGRVQNTMKQKGSPTRLAA